MRVESRKTAGGTEYWDTKEKKTIFVAAGNQPKFDVTKDPKSMVKEEGHNPEVKTNNETHFSFDDMNAEQLLEFAQKNNIEVPGNMKKEETIRKHIAESLAADKE